MNKIGFHLLFWVFISLYVFDYFIDSYSIEHSLIYTLFEVSIYTIEFYVNLLLLLPLLFHKRYKIAYFLSVLALLSISCSAYFIAGINDELLAPDMTRAISSFFLNHALFILISYFVWYYSKYLSEKEKRLQLENDKLLSEMKFLKSQISPHFLFNSLNNIYSLTMIKSDDAPKMIAELSDILRYFLYEGNKEYVYLDSEIDIINKYIQIQKFRQIPGMDNIQIEVSGDPSILKVPPLIMINLIENAFKHGDIIETEEGFVKISIVIDGTWIEFEVSNSFQPKTEGNGLGLKNIKSQLDILFGENYQIQIDASDFTYTLKVGFNGCN